MFRCLIKGPAAQVEAALREHDIPASQALDPLHHSYLVDIPDEHEDALAKWYRETDSSQCNPEGGYPAGTLLYYWWGRYGRGDLSGEEDGRSTEEPIG
jgi:hypothetical protein